MRTLLLGLGNPILTDDAVGIRLAGAVAARLAGAPGLDCVTDCSAGGLEWLEVVAGYDRLIVVDSILTAGGRPGDWYHFTAASLRETAHLASVHDANFATALALGRALGVPLPPDGEIHIFAVEVEENALFGERLTPRVEAALPRVCEEVLEAARALIEPGRAPDRAAEPARPGCGPRTSSGTRA